MGTHCECGICGHFDEKEETDKQSKEKPVTKKSVKKNKKTKLKK